MFGETARLAVDLSLQGNFTSGITGASGALAGLNRNVGQIGRGVGQVAGGLSRLALVAGGVVAVGIGAAAKAAINFEDAFAGVRKTVDEADLAAAGMTFEGLAKQFREMATEIPIAATEFARLGEAAGALGVKAQDIDDFARVTALLGVTTNLTADEAANSLGKIGTILGLTGKQYESFADVLVNLGNKGASTEAEIIEITKRFGAAGQAAGLSTEQILAFSSAIASAGVEPEAAGSSLSRLFGNLIKETALASDAGKSFAEITGKSFKDFSKIVKDDTVGAMLLFLDSLRGLGKFEQELALEAVGITAVRDRNAIRLLAESYDRNLIPALETARTATGALSIEAEKRFDTVRSKLQLLKNNAIEAAITFGEGLAPAIGRTAESLADFLRDEDNKRTLRELGQDVGKFIDGIDWKGLAENAKTAGAAISTGAKTISALLTPIPDQVKAVGAALLIAFNSPVLGGALKSIASGLGNIVAGLGGIAARGIASRIPGVGPLFAQPVYVVNWPMGGLGGPGAVGGKGIGGFLGTVALATTSIALVGAAVATFFDQKQGIETLASSIGESVKEQVEGGASKQDLLTSQAALKSGLDEIARLRAQVGTVPILGLGLGPLTDLLSGDTQRDLEHQLALVEEELARLNAGGLPRPSRPERAGERPMDTGPQSLARTLAELFGTHGTAAGAFGGAQLKQFRTDPAAAVALFDERIRYLAGAQGAGGGSEQYLAVVSRDIAALNALLPRATEEQKTAITAEIQVLEGILAAKKFEITPGVIEAAGQKQGRDSTEQAEKTRAAVYDGARDTKTAVDRSTTAAERTKSAIDFASISANSRTDSVRNAIQTMQGAVVSAIQALDLKVSLSVSAKDVTTQQNVVSTYDPPTTLNKGGKLVPS